MKCIGSQIVAPTNIPEPTAVRTRPLGEATKSIIPESDKFKFVSLEESSCKQEGNGEVGLLVDGFSRKDQSRMIESLFASRIRSSRDHKLRQKSVKAAMPLKEVGLVVER